MAKVGLKETLTLLAAGYKKKDIDALAAIDEETEGVVPGNNADTNPSAAPIITDSAPAKHENQENDKEPDPDYKTMYEEIQAKLKESEEKVKKLQQDNIHKDSSPDVEASRKQEAESLTNLVRGFM